MLLFFAWRLAVCGGRCHCHPTHWRKVPILYLSHNFVWSSFQFRKVIYLRLFPPSLYKGSSPAPIHKNVPGTFRRCPHHIVQTISPRFRGNLFSFKWPDDKISLKISPFASRQISVIGRSSATQVNLSGRSSCHQIEVGGGGYNRHVSLRNNKLDAGVSGLRSIFGKKLRSKNIVVREAAAYVPAFALKYVVAYRVEVSKMRCLCRTRPLAAYKEKSVMIFFPSVSLLL